MSAGSHPNGELKAALKAVEARLARGERMAEGELEQLRALAGARGSLPAPLSRRLAQVMATHALRTRRAPGSVLEGLYEDVRSATLDERFTRARVSNTYLDAPRSLVVWRRTAAAACALAAISLGWALSTGDTPSGVRPPSQVERYSLLDGVLERYDPTVHGLAPATVGGPSHVHEVGGPYTSGAASTSQDRSRRRPSVQVFSWPGQSRGIVYRVRVGVRAPVLGRKPVEVEKN